MPNNQDVTYDDFIGRMKWCRAYAHKCRRGGNLFAFRSWLGFAQNALETARALRG